MRSRDELAEEVALAMLTGEPEQFGEAFVAKRAYDMADALLARRAPLGDHPAASNDEGWATMRRASEASSLSTAALGEPWPAASETPAVKFKVGDRVRVKRLSFHEGVGVDWPTRTKGYKVGNEFDVAWASPDGDKVDRANGSGQYLFADEIELVPPASPPPASPARSESPVALDIETKCPKCGESWREHDGDEVEMACRYNPKRLATPAPRDEAKDEARRTPAFLPPGDDVDAAIAYAKTVHPVSDARFYAALDAFLEGTRWRARDGGR